MTNKKIAQQFNLLADLMELHRDNPFKIRSYQSAYRTLRKLDTPLAELTDADIGAIKGIGKAITGKIRELLDTGRMATLEKWRTLTPPGLVEMLSIRGFGAKKVRALWTGLEIETIGELLYACNENRLVELKGFGPKTQADLQQKLEYYLRSRDRFRYAQLEREATELRTALRERLPGVRVEWTGALRRRANVVDAIELLIGAETIDGIFDASLLTKRGESTGRIEARTANDFPVWLYTCSPENFGSKWFRRTGSTLFLQTFRQLTEGQDFQNLPTEQAIFERASLAYLPAELRENERHLNYARTHTVPDLVEVSDIKGVVHLHTTWSDGIASLEQMANACRERGYQYLGLTDHSKSAFYANGLKPARLREQWAEADALNAQLTDFRIFKGIESDILGDGSLDYEEEILKGFDFVIASVHSHLKMDEAKATERIVRAVENPYTTILGHPTGRLLLSRVGYPLDHKRVIDACAANGVAIELNANPYRLDLDWTWIPYATERGVMISINPDAHSTEGIDDLHYGVLSARKGGLTAERCLTALDAAGFAAWLGE